MKIERVNNLFNFTLVHPIILNGNIFLRNSGYIEANSIKVLIENKEMNDEFKENRIKCGSKFHKNANFRYSAFRK